jgi:hypothetical protein
MPQVLPVEHDAPDALANAPAVFALDAKSEILRLTWRPPHLGQTTSLTDSALRTSSSNERSHVEQLNS